MRGIFEVLTLAAMTSACESNVFSLAARDGGHDAKADALGPVPVIFSEDDPPRANAAAFAIYSLNR